MWFYRLKKAIPYSSTTKKYVYKILIINILDTEGSSCHPDTSKKPSNRKI